MRLLLLLICVFMLGLIIRLEISYRSKIKNLESQIQTIHSIVEVQESWLRSCGFYGEEP